MPGRHHHEVTPLELFFDLVFVFAISQLSHHLLAHTGWHSAAETLVLLVAVLTVWSYTSWTATMAHADTPATRTMVLAVMVPGLFMNAAIPDAFGEAPWAFVVPMLVIQFGRTLWTIAKAQDDAFREHFRRVLAWLLATSLLWIGGALADPGARLWWWGLAAAIDLAGTWLAHPLPGRRLHSENLEFDGAHWLERSNLFLIIALGETLLMTGTAIAHASVGPMTVLTGTLATVCTIALWALVFGPSNAMTRRHLDGPHDAVHTSRQAINALIPMVAGLVAVAVANEKVIAHPLGHPEPAAALLLTAGPILFMLGQWWFLRQALSFRSRLHAWGALALVPVGLVGLFTPPLVVLVLATAVLLVMVKLEAR